MQVEEAARGLASRQYMLSVTQSVKAEAIKLLSSKPSKIDKVREREVKVAPCDVLKITPNIFIIIIIISIFSIFILTHTHKPTTHARRRRSPDTRP